MRYTEMRLCPKTNVMREYVVTKTYGRIRAHDRQDKTVGECINSMESAISLNGTITGLPYHVTGVYTG